MKVLTVRNVHEALPLALQLLYTEGMKRDSRNGPVLAHPEPVTTVYTHPCERVMFHEWRDANPFFHFYESLWMLAGRNDLAPLTRYVSTFGNYSDDGRTLNAAYGYRWRQMPTRTQYSKHESGDEPTDQLIAIARELRANRDSRQCVLQIWDHERDLGTVTKDHACNIATTFQVGLDDRLHMSVFCRSNDILFGCYGANAVHFSMLLEYVAARVGVPVGMYTQISVNWHGYEKTCGPMMEFKSTEQDAGSPYEYEPLYPEPIVYPVTGGDPTEMMDRWDADCRSFVTADGRAPSSIRPDADPFWYTIAFPIVAAHDIWKDHKDWRTALSILQACQAEDWKLACQQWIKRRMK